MVNTNLCASALHASLVSSLLALGAVACDVGSESQNIDAGGNSIAGTSGGGASALDGARGGSTGSTADSASGGSGGMVPCLRPPGMPAVSLTYDDSLSSHLTTVGPALLAHRLAATFFVMDVRSDTAPWAALRAQGNELAAHTFLHPCAAANSWVKPGDASEDYDLARMATELDGNIQMLQTLGQPPPYTFAYPCGLDWVGQAHQSFVPLVKERFAAARGVVGGLIKPGVNLWNVPAYFSTAAGPALIAIVEQAKAQGAWVVFGFHGVGADHSPVTAEAHEQLLAYLDQNREGIYVAPFGAVAACLAAN